MIFYSMLEKICVVSLMFTQVFIACAYVLISKVKILFYLGLISLFNGVSILVDVV